MKIMPCGFFRLNSSVSNFNRYLAVILCNCEFDSLRNYSCTIRQKIKKIYDNIAKDFLSF